MASCSNFYDWYGQSSQHMGLSNGNWPLISEIAAISSSRVDFDQRIRELFPGEVVEAENEKADWWRRYGFEWGQNQCVEEETPGQSGAEGKSTWTKGKADPDIDDVKAIQRGLRAGGYDPGKIDGKWGSKSCGAAYLFKIERLKDYNRDLDWNFFASIGFPGQDGQDYAKKYGTICRPYYAKYVKTRESDVEAVQQALVKKGYLAEDRINGKWDSVTCQAIFKFQRNTFGDTKRGLLDRETFIALGFAPATAGTFESLYSTKCQGYWGGDEDVKPKPEPKKPQDDADDDVVIKPRKKPQINKAGVGLLLGILALGAAAGGVYISRKK